jgi:hypothetical protein
MGRRRKSGSGGAAGQRRMRNSGQNINLSQFAQQKNISKIMLAPERYLVERHYVKDAIKKSKLWSYTRKNRFEKNVNCVFLVAVNFFVIGNVETRCSRG